MRRRYYLVTTEHLEDGLWFRDEEDFCVGMNYVAIQTCWTRVAVWAFILMSNHLHFVLKGSAEEARAFVEGLKSRFSLYLNRKYGSIEFLRRNGVDIREISEVDEALERAIAYVQMNCVAANICSYAGQYPWGTGNVFFQVEKPAGKSLSAFSLRAKRRLMHTWTDLAYDGFLVGEKGYVLPESYVAVDEVESLFRNAKRMNYFLNTSSKARRQLDSYEGGLPAFKDQLVQGAIPDLCHSLFRKTFFTELSPQEKSELLRHMRYRFCSNINQIARVTGLPYAEAAHLLDRE